MTEKTFKAMIVEETPEKKYSRRIGERAISELPKGDVLVRVAWSSLNFKDALSATGNKGVTRNFPHTPGIDAAGIVEESSSAKFSKGDEVIVTSYDLGMNTSGGFGQYIRVPAEWVVKRPEGLTLKEGMAFGTAGLTAGLSVYQLVKHDVTPEKGEVLVTGASGGVGSVAAAILAKIGFDVTAVSGKDEAFLKSLGVKKVIKREEAVDTSKRPLLGGLWAGVVDTVGGDILATALKGMKPHSTATCCGLVMSPALNTTVFPFILRGVTLVGIDSQDCPMDIRVKVWEKLASDWKIDMLDDITAEVNLAELDSLIDTILKGGIKGRTVVDLSK